jgi:hypothetical protein
MLYWRDEVNGLVDMGIRVYTVAAAGSAPPAVLFLKELAKSGQGFYVDLGGSFEPTFAGWDMLCAMLENSARIASESQEVADEDFTAINSLERIAEKLTEERVQTCGITPPPPAELEAIREVEEEAWWDRRKDHTINAYKFNGETGVWDKC